MGIGAWSRGALTLSVAVVVAAAVVAWHFARGERGRTSAVVPAMGPMVDPSLRFVDRRLLVDPAGVAVTVPDPWTAGDLPVGPGMSVVLRHPAGANLLAVATRRSPGTGSEPTLRGILEDKRKQYGDVGDVVWNVERVGGFPARTLAFTPRPPEGTVRLKVWMLGNDAYWVTFTCGAAVADFAAREADCHAVVDTFHVAQGDASR